MITRARTSAGHSGTDYIYTLLRGYYRDSSSPTGWNNIAYPNIAMPNIFGRSKVRAKHELNSAKRARIKNGSGAA